MTNPDLLAAFRADMQSRKLSTETIRIYGWILQDFAERMQARGVALTEVKRPDLKAYLDDLNTRNISHKTASIRFGAIGNFYDFLVFEEILEVNPVKAVQKRYLQAYKTPAGHTHRLISVEQAATMLHELADIRDKAIFILLLKTGMRRNELISLDVDDINWDNQSITLKPAPKRTNRIVFFDDEAAEYLKRWLRLREHRNTKRVPALFVTPRGRIGKSGVDYLIKKAAILAGLYDASSDRLEDHVSSHCARHFFTTVLDEAGMKREHIQMLRGDAGKAAIDIYIHHNLNNIRKEYLACIPLLG
jgi:integrase/recombinase XerD